MKIDIDDLTDDQIDRLQERLDARREILEFRDTVLVEPPQTPPPPVNRKCIVCGYIVRRAGQLHGDNKYCNRCWDNQRRDY